YLDDIVSGGADGEIDWLIEKLDSYGRPVYVRFGYEVDAPWNGYDPGLYKQAFVRFANRIHPRDATHVAMVVHSASYCGGTRGTRPMSDWYPGDAYVDWAGLSYFVPASCSYAKVDEVVEFARQHGKPVMIAESTPQGYDLARLTYSADGRAFSARTS